MRKLFCLFALLCAMVFVSLPACGDTRALLVACSDFITQPDLGSTLSGNLHMIGSALLGASPALSGLSIEDGTIGTPEALDIAIGNAFGSATEEDLSLLYLCTHGVPSADDGKVYLLLSDGENESSLSSEALYAMLRGIQGDKLLILDACYSGAFLGRSEPDPAQLRGESPLPAVEISPFIADTSSHVITSASCAESSWYYDAEGLETGAVSYFSSALSSGLGLYGTAQADVNGDGAVSLQELHRHLSLSVASSSCQLFSSNAQALTLPAARGAMLSRPLVNFSYGDSLLSADDPTFDFSFTVAQETSVQYRLIEYENGSWNWAQAQTFMDGDAPLARGWHERSLTLPTVKPEDKGYLMLQVFSVTGGELRLCSEQLIAVSPSPESPELTLIAPDVFSSPGASELPIRVSLGMPAEITLSVYDEEGALIRRLAYGQMTRPHEDDALYLYWDGRDAQGERVPAGRYTLTAETFAGFKRLKTSEDVLLSSGG